MPEVPKRIYGLDILKALCAFCVVTIHARFPGRVGDYIDAWTRMAVPIFFMITGFFYKDTQRQKREAEQIIRVLALGLASNALYIAWHTFFEFGGNLGSYLRFAATPQNLWGYLTLNESPFGYHLWYLSAMLYVLIIVYVLNRVFPRHAERMLFIAAPFLLLINLVFGNYSLLLLQSEYRTVITRNFLFVGMPYFAVGMFLRTYRGIVEALVAKRRLLASAILFFLLTTCMEKFLSDAFRYCTNREHYASTAFLSILVFSAFTSPFWEGKLPILHDVGRKHATGIYMVHLMVMAVLDSVINRLQMADAFQYIRPFAIYLVSLWVCMLYGGIRSTLQSGFRMLFRHAASNRKRL